MKLRVYFGHQLNDKDRVTLCYVFSEGSGQCYSFFNDSCRTRVMDMLKQRYKEERLEFADELPIALFPERGSIGVLEGKVLEDLKSEITGTHL